MNRGFDLDRAVPWGRTSRHLEPLRAARAARGYASEIRELAWEFRRGGNRMLCVSKTRGLAP